ncbi:MAG TPA: polyphosphate kinase 1 [Cytophagales bacterium]|jgi:polyphosphate kinase|nr:polyphosphate kinase 1 [Cytophagales bacterium]
MKETDKIPALIEKSDLISRDLSWMKFNHRVLDQAKHLDRSIFDRLKFMAITASNLDEFFMIRVGSLYNYIDYGKERIDYSGLRERPFKRKLYQEIHDFCTEQSDYFNQKLMPLAAENGFHIVRYHKLPEGEKDKSKYYFKKTIFPMLTPMVFDNYHTFPILMNQILVFGVVTVSAEDTERKKLSFIQVPQNLPKFFEIERGEQVIFVPIEDIIRTFVHKLFRNIEIESVTLFRITRNGDFTLEESDDIDANFLEELKRKLKTRRTGRVVRIEIDKDYDPWMRRILQNRWELEEDNFFEIDRSDLFDYTRLWQIIKSDQLKERMQTGNRTVQPLTYPEEGTDNVFDILKERDVLLHHPYNNIEPLLELIEQSAEDPKVLAIKLTIYRLAKDSRITSALLKAAENGKHVSVLFEVKARFDEENNLKEAKSLQKAGCFVIYGVSNLKTHTKLLLIVRKESNKVTRYVHMSSGNYNETTSKLYTDIGILTTNEIYAHDVSEFFNAITGHSQPKIYQYLLTAPRDMRKQLIELIRNEAENAKNGLPSGIVIKINSLQDKRFIRALYEASQAGVPIKLIVRGICCIRPGRKGLSENIEVYSIVGDFLEHSRLYYFHNNNDSKIYGGSADVMVRSFDRRIESLFLIVDPVIKQQAMNILAYNLRDNVNAYVMNEDGSYEIKTDASSEPFNIHKKFYNVKLEEVLQVKLF